jgi:competence protein ComEA
MMMDIDKRLLAAAVVVLIVGFFGGMKYADFKAEKEQARLTLTEAAEATVPQNEKAETNTVKDIKVYVTGAVSKPGVYSLREGDRVYQAVEMAGGLLADAEAKGVNMAAPLKDGDPIVIPKKGEEISPNTNQLATANQSAKSGKVNINTANVQELDSLKGIGPALAQRIVDYRESHGPFKSLEDLKKVSGIGEKKFADLIDSICM